MGQDAVFVGYVQLYNIQRLGKPPQFFRRHALLGHVVQYILNGFRNGNMFFFQCLFGSVKDNVQMFDFRKHTVGKNIQIRICLGLHCSIQQPIADKRNNQNRQCKNRHHRNQHFDFECFFVSHDYSGVNVEI